MHLFSLGMTRDFILHFLRLNRQHLERNLGVKRIGLFGSYATGMEHSQSDVDLLVEQKEANYRKLVELQDYLEENLHANVDLVRKGPHLRRPFLERIESEIVYA